jgi:1,4-dihydroxy-2-naphthoate octaprenyltransferase
LPNSRSPEAPSGVGGLIARATRVKTLPLVLVPVVIGAGLADHRTGRVSWAWLAVSAVGAGLLHLAANVLNDVADHRAGVDKIIRMDRGGIATDPGLLEKGIVRARWMLGLAAALLGAALGLGIVTAVAREAWVVAFGAAGAALGTAYGFGPRYGYRGFGPVGITLAYGPLAVAGTYYVQTGGVEVAVWWASLLPGVLAALALFHADLLHHRADLAAQKKTLAARFGPGTALFISAAAITTIFAGLTLLVALEVFPLWSLTGLVGAPALVAAWQRDFRDPAPQHHLALLGSTLGANVIVGAAVALSLFLG